MGTGCSKSVMVVSSSKWEHGVHRSRSCTSNTSTTASGSTIRTLAEASIWSPFQVSRTEAEQLLSRAEPGAFVFSHDMTSELFLSISVGKYVCHHAVLTRDQGYYVGARKFTTIGDVVDYFKDHPLGETKLKQECKTLPRCTSQVQIKQHPDICISCPAANNSANYHHLVESDQRSSTVQTSIAVIDNNDSQSPLITLTPHYELPESEGNAGDGSPRINLTENLHNKQDERQTSKRNRADSMTRKHLTRAMAIDRTDSSGEFQETALSPLLQPKKTAKES